MKSELFCATTLNNVSLSMSVKFPARLRVELTDAKVDRSSSTTSSYESKATVCAIIVAMTLTLFIFNCLTVTKSALTSSVISSIPGHKATSKNSFRSKPLEIRAENMIREQYPGEPHHNQYNRQYERQYNEQLRRPKPYYPDGREAHNIPNDNRSPVFHRLPSSEYIPAHTLFKNKCNHADRQTFSEKYGEHGYEERESQWRDYDRSNESKRYRIERNCLFGIHSFRAKMKETLNLSHIIIAQ